MKAAAAKRCAAEALAYMRENYDKPYGNAMCVGYAWSALAHIAGDSAPSPWESRVAEQRAEQPAPSTVEPPNK